MHTISKTLSISLSVLTSVSLLACSSNQKPDSSTPGSESTSSGGTGGKTSGNSAPFKLGLIPYETPQTELEQYVLFGQFIGKAINGTPADVQVASDYAGVITALENGQIDAAYLNPLGYVLASDRAQKAGRPLTPIAMPEVIPEGEPKGSLTYRGIIFVRKDSGINSLKELKGKNVAFNEQTSTSGYLYPYAILLRNGVNAKPAREGGDLKEVFFAGAQGVPPAVMNRQADAGAIFEEGIRLSYKNPADRAQFKVLAYTDPIPNGMLVARSDLAPDVLKKLKKAMVDVNTDPEGKKALQAMHVSKWDLPEDSLFDPVRKTASVLGLDLKALEKPRKK